MFRSLLSRSTCVWWFQFLFVLVLASSSILNTRAAEDEETQDDLEEDEASKVAEHPFLEVYGLLNGSWAKFFVIVVAASRLAVVFPRIGLPLITGYMIIGCLCGPYVLGLVTKPQIPDLSYVTQTALAFIAFSAGSELYLPELRSLLRTIALITGFNALFSYFLCTVFIYLIALGGVIPWMEPYIGSCAFSISMIAGSIMVARSPASAIAVVRELRAKGPATSIMLGVTVVGDVVVLVLFTLSNSFALAMCGGGGFDGGAFFITLLTLCCAVGLGYGLGFLLIFLLWIPPVKVSSSISIPIPAKFTIIPLGFLIFVCCDWIVVWTEHHWGVGLNFDALLICITAGYVVTNKSQNRIAFLKMLGGAGSYIFIPFFTLVGVQLNLDILVQSIGFGFLVFFMRGICVLIGSFVGGTLAGLDKDKRLKLWMTMLAQAGVSLGLAAEVAVKFPEWGSKFQTTIISVVLINQFVGPVLCKYALKQFGEAGKMLEGEEDEHGHGGGGGAGHGTEGGLHADGGMVEVKKLKRAVICGVDSTALAVASKLLKLGWRVTLMDTEKTNLILAKCLGVPKKDTRSTLEGDSNNVASTTPTAASSVAGVASSDQQQADEDPLLVHSSHSIESDSIALDMTPSSSSLLLEKEPILDLLLVPSSQASQLSISQAYSSQLETPLPNFEVCILGLTNDSHMYELGSYFLRTRSCSRILCRLHNPTWFETYKIQGLLPISQFGSSNQTILSAVLSRGNLQFVSTTLSLKDALETLIDPVEDLQYIQLPMSGSERFEWEEQHPGPSEEVLNNIRQHLNDIIVDGESEESIRLLSTVSHGQREDYLDKLHRLHSLEDHTSSTKIEHHDEQHKTMFMNISQHRQTDEDAAAARQAEAAEAEAAEEKQVQMALGNQTP